MNDLVKEIAENNLVAYHNNLADLALKDFNAKERDLLMALCSKAKDCGTDDITLPFREIRKLANYKQTSNKVLGKDLDHMTNKLMSLRMKSFSDTGDIIKFVLFPYFRISTEKGMLSIRVGEEFSYLINELGANFTSFELEEHTSLKSIYSKECYRQMMRYKDKGIWWVYADRFRELLDLPEGYRNEDIKAKILPRIDAELSTLFAQFSSSVEYRNGKPYRYIFRFRRFETDNSCEEETKCVEISDKSESESQRANHREIETVINAWNEISEETQINKILKLPYGSDRYKRLVSRLNEYGLESVLRAVKNIKNSPFLRGEKTNWKITFDWFVRPNNFLKVLEGNYNNDTNEEDNLERMRELEKKIKSEREARGAKW